MDPGQAPEITQKGRGRQIKLDQGQRVLQAIQAQLEAAGISSSIPTNSFLGAYRSGNPLSSEAKDYLYRSLLYGQGTALNRPSSTGLSYRPTDNPMPIATQAILPEAVQQMAGMKGYQFGQVIGNTGLQALPAGQIPIPALAWDNNSRDSRSQLVEIPAVDQRGRPLLDPNTLRIISSRTGVPLDFERKGIAGTHLFDTPRAAGRIVKTEDIFKDIEEEYPVTHKSNTAKDVTHIEDIPFDTPEYSNDTLNHLLWLEKQDEWTPINQVSSHYQKRLAQGFDWIGRSLDPMSADSGPLAPFLERYFNERQLSLFPAENRKQDNFVAGLRQALKAPGSDLTEAIIDDLAPAPSTASRSLWPSGLQQSQDYGPWRAPAGAMVGERTLDPDKNINANIYRSSPYSALIEGLQNRPELADIALFNARAARTGITPSGERLPQANWVTEEIERAQLERQAQVGREGAYRKLADLLHAYGKQYTPAKERLIYGSSVSEPTSTGNHFANEITQELERLAKSPNPMRSMNSMDSGSQSPNPEIVDWQAFDNESFFATDRTGRIRTDARGIALIKPDPRGLGISTIRILPDYEKSLQQAHNFLNAGSVLKKDWDQYTAKEQAYRIEKSGDRMALMPLTQRSALNYSPDDFLTTRDLLGPEQFHPGFIDHALLQRTRLGDPFNIYAQYQRTMKPNQYKMAQTDLPQPINRVPNNPVSYSSPIQNAIATRNNDQQQRDLRSFAGLQANQGDLPFGPDYLRSRLTQIALDSKAALPRPTESWAISSWDRKNPITLGLKPSALGLSYRTHRS